MIKNLESFDGDFVAQNIYVHDDALFDCRFAGSADFDEASGWAFKPYVIKSVGEVRIAIVGQAFPCPPIAPR